MSSNLLKVTLEKLNYPVARMIYEGKEDIFFTFTRVVQTPINYSDDESHGNSHVYRVNLFTKGNFEALLANTIEILKTDGFTILSVDGEIYEKETKLYNVPITVNIYEE